MAISHYGVIANVIQMATHYRLNDPSWPNKRMSPGDIVLAGTLIMRANIQYTNLF